MQTTIVVLSSSEDMRGRALGVMTVSIGAGPIGALMIGYTANAISPSFAIGMNGVLGIGAMALVWLFMPALRQPISTDQQITPKSINPATSSAD